MPQESLLLFIPTCFALNLAPGPNNLLSVSHATRYGFWPSCIAGLGRLVAFIGMIAIAATGLATVLLASQALFSVVKILGALYLFHLAFQLWSAAPTAHSAAGTEGGSVRSGRTSTYSLAKREFLVAAGNPKAILIFTAFLPQFIDTAQATTPQFALLGSLFLVLEWIAIAAYAYLGSHLRRWFAHPRRQRLFNRICGSLLGLAGIGLLAARRATSGA